MSDLQTFEEVLERRICRVLGFGGTETPKLSGTNDFTAQFSKNLVVQIHRLFHSSLSGR